jgi:hypothetical protein
VAPLRNDQRVGSTEKAAVRPFSHPAQKPSMVASAGWLEKMSGKDPKRARRASILLFAIFVVGVGAIVPRPASSGPKDDTTGTVSKAEPAIKQDGTPAHPYTDASQCPSSTDLIIWPNGRSVPSLPPGISVCFVGNQSFNDGASDVRVRQR